MIEFYFSHQIGFAFFGIGALIVGICALGAALFAVLRTRTITKKLETLFAGKKAEDLEKIILRHSTSLKNFDKEIQELFDISNKINTRTGQCLQKVGVVRFNPFKDIGGDQSFVIALLDDSDSGFVFSSLHTRDGTRVYTKPIVKGETTGDHELTDEESQAIKIAHPHKLQKNV